MKIVYSLLIFVFQFSIAVFNHEFNEFDNFDVKWEQNYVRPNEPQISLTNTEHYDSDGKHDSIYDREILMGSHNLAEQFKELDPEEAKHKLGELFDRIDLNRDEKINKDELKQWIIQSLTSLDLESSKPRFKEYDLNQDGQISWSEYTNRVYGYSNEELEEMRKDNGNETQLFLQSIDDEYLKFKSADSDNDTKLNETEFAIFEHPHNYQQMAKYEVKHTLNDFDKNKDGFISESEYLADDKMHKDAYLIEKENFKNYDTNKDGKLDENEMALWVTPGFEKIANDETVHLFSETDKNQDNYLTKQEVLNQHELWIGSQATDYGRHLENNIKDEL